MSVHCYLDYNDNDQEIEVTDPPADLIRECIEMLDNSRRSDVCLMLRSLFVTISGASAGRVSVMVTRINDQVPVFVLMDPTVSGEHEITLLTGSQYVIEPLNQTVPLQKAIDVVLYCFENDEIPDGLEWAER
jgi:xanthine/CO dehydrogenase XdhC/CoxF family maturation factor